MHSTVLLSTLNLSLGGLVFLLGLVILRENPGQRLNRIVAAMLFFGGFGAVLAALGFLAAPGSAGTRVGANVQDALRNASYVWELYFPSLFLFASIFPEERAYARRPLLAWGPWSAGFTVVVFAPHVFHLLLVLLVTAWRPELAAPRTGPLHVAAPILGVVGLLFRLFLTVHQALFSLVNLGFGLATMALLFDSLRKTRVPRLQRQIRSIAIGLSASLVCYSLATSIPTLLNIRIPEGVRSGLTIAALTLGPGSIAYSVVRWKFLDTRLLARRGILYALTSAALVGIYLMVVNPLNDFVAARSGIDEDVFRTAFFIMALALFQPVIARLEELLDRTLLKDPADYRNVVRQLGRDLQTTIDLEVVLSRTVGTLAESLLLRSAHVVALTPAGAIAQTGAGAPLGPDTLRWLARVLPAVGTRQASWRLDEPVDGLSRDDQAAMVRELGLSLLVPLRWRGDPVGALLLGDKLTGTAFTSEDVTLLGALGTQVSVSLQNALLLRDRVAVARFEEELNLARQIQRTSLLSEFPAMPCCEVHALYLPSKHVGGDFYDVVATGDGGYLVAIADVSGKGVPAALLSAMLQASLRTQAGARDSLGGILRNINHLLYRSTATHQFATFFLARVDGDRGRMSFSNAGHNWPVLLRSNGERVFLERGGTILGILEGAEFEEDQVSLSPGDRVVLYTDGISEATNAAGELFGEQRLCEVVESLPRHLPARDVAERAFAAVREFLGDVEPQDDITLVVLRVLEPSPAETMATPVAEAVGAG